MTDEWADDDVCLVCGRPQDDHEPGCPEDPWLIESDKEGQ